MSDITYKVENVVSTINLTFKDRDKVDLLEMSKTLSDVEYNPERFPGLIMKFNNPRSTALIFSTGKVVCTGLIQPAYLKYVIQLIKANFSLCGIEVTDVQSEIQNIVATSDFHGMIDLNKVAYTMQNTIYEPEVFPGAIHRMLNPKAVFLIFSTGKIVCTGAKSIEDVENAIIKLDSLLKEYKVISEGEVYGESEGLFL